MDNLFAFGKEFLGPIVVEYLVKLDATIAELSHSHNTSTWFVSRAGVRIRELYSEFLVAQGRDMPRNTHLAWLSRFLCVKGLWADQPERSGAILTSEFAFSTLHDLITAIFRSTGLPPGCNLSDYDLSTSAKDFNNFIWSDHPVAHSVRWHLSDQNAFLRTYVKQISGSCDTILLVDSGWQGTTQNLLADWDQNHRYIGAYFGRCGSQMSDRRFWDDMRGLVFESDSLDQYDSATAIILHRHLIETLFEPNADSVEHLAWDEDLGVIFSPASPNLLTEQRTREVDQIFEGVKSHVTNMRRPVSIKQIMVDSLTAKDRLASVITFPTRAEATLLASMDRSADFGRTLKVPVLLKPQNRSESDSSERRVLDALWPSAQCALEYPSFLAKAHQRQIVGLPLEKSWPVDRRNAAWISARTVNNAPKVAVITRTKDRPLFLHRALESVARQSYQNYIHVVVHDGGPIDDTLSLIRSANCDHRKVILVDNIINRGMEAASNIGIRSSESELVTIHDDDDSWHEEFLAKSVEFLQKKKETYSGVISHTWYVSEEVNSTGIKFISQRGYHDWVNNVQMMEMACENFFAPISFVFTREACEAIGMFDENFPVLGDWDFNLRFLEQFNIGVIPEKLASYHHRDIGNKFLFPNSVVGSIDKHAEYHAVLRNKYLRRSSSMNNPASGIIINLAFSLADVRLTGRRALNAAQEIPNLLSKAVGSTEIETPSHRENENFFEADRRWLGMQVIVADLEEENRQLREKIEMLQLVSSLTNTSH